MTGASLAPLGCSLLGAGSLVGVLVGVLLGLNPSSVRALRRARREGS